MPEGNAVHRIAEQFRRNFVGRTIAVTSPQGRFASGAKDIDGHTMLDAQAVGKQLFLEFSNKLWLRVHLGMYGAWDFAGEITIDDALRATGGRIGQTQQRGIPSESSVSSIGAPRRGRVHVRMAEHEKLTSQKDDVFPPEPYGAVRVRLLTDAAVADLRGPTACEVIDPSAMEDVIARLGPDPLRNNGPDIRQRFVDVVSAKKSSIGLLLMDQSVVAGIGNVYRAELLFRARLNPHTPGRELDARALEALWQDWSLLLQRGFDTGLMVTIDDLDAASYARALENREDRHWVYKRDGLPCRVCRTNVVMEMMASRKLYWCPSCQA